MNDLWNRRRRQRAFGPGSRSRAGRRAWGALVAALGAILLVGLTSTAAMANAAAPTASPLTSGDVVQNADGTVTVTAGGTWLWSFGVEGPTTAGLAATINHPCDNRSGVGWGVIWSDPNDPGVAETYHTNGKVAAASQTVNVGSKGVNPFNSDDHVMFDPGHRCGTFVQTNIPHPGDGYDTGIWRASHTYASASALPRAVCVVTYDLGFAKPPTPHRISFENNDNSVQWALFKNGAYDTAAMGANCEELPPPVAAPPTTTTVPPPVKTVSHTTPPPTHVATKPSGTLAFTGFGKTGQLLALLGTILVLVGIVLYFFDVRRAALWLLGL